MTEADLLTAYQSMLDRYGHQQWWPADTSFEVMVGAILTQNTAWHNVEKAINNLRRENRLSLQAMLDCPQQELAQWIRPSGYFNVKTNRLINLCHFIQAAGGEQVLATWETDKLRTALLSVNGIGPETADDIMLYAFQRPCFVIDTYTRRIFSRIGFIQGTEPYQELRQSIEATLGTDTTLYKEYHALIVQHAKQTCLKKPFCQDCCLMKSCAYLQG